MGKTINQALKELYLSLGGDPSALEDNSTVSDYIADLENGLKSLAELPTPAVGDIGKSVGVVSDGEGGAKYGFIQKQKIEFSYTSKDGVYGYYPNVNGKTATLQELYEYFVELGLAGAQTSTLLENYFDFVINVSGDPNLPSDWTTAGVAPTRFTLDLLSGWVIGGDYYSYEIKGTQFSSPLNVTSHAGIANIYAAIVYNQWAQSATVEVKTLLFET